jgi:hypothetical protein
VVEEITRKEGKQRAKVIKDIADIGTYCLKFSNMSSAIAICHGLNNPSVDRVEPLRCYMSESTRKTLEWLKTLEQRDDRYLCDGLCVPSIEEHLTLADKGKYNAPRVMHGKEPLFNGEAMDLYSQLIAKVLQAQSMRYNFKGFPKLQNLILATFIK